MSDRCQVPRIHIVGRRNAGKTTLVCDLIREFTRRGLRVATVKHTHHEHELDTPGKDSWQHRAAGAAGVGILSPGMIGLFLPADRESRSEDDRYRVFADLFAHMDLLIVEGDLHTTARRVEVWRPVTGDDPWAVQQPGIAAVITDDACPSWQGPIWPRSDLSGIADRILSLTTAPQSGSQPS